MRKFWKRRIPFLLILAALGLAAWFIWNSRGQNSPPIPAQGGEPFQNFSALESTHYLQDDARWKNETLGNTSEKLGGSGCAICCLAMAISHFGFSLNPKELNDAVKSNRGFTWRGLVKWNVVSKITREKVVIETVTKPGHSDIDKALRAGQPVLAKLLLNGSTPHWVLIIGKKNLIYLIRDPLGDGNLPEPITKNESDIFGIRIVKSAQTH